MSENGRSFFNGHIRIGVSVPDKEFTPGRRPLEEMREWYALRRVVFFATVVAGPIALCLLVEAIGDLVGN